MAHLKVKRIGNHACHCWASRGLISYRNAVLQLLEALLIFQVEWGAIGHVLVFRMAFNA